MQNAFVESFNARFLDNCLNRHWCRDLPEARRLIKNWRRHYYQERPHSSLGYTTPEAYAAKASATLPAALAAYRVPLGAAASAFG